ncbi:hypothetical protein [Intestinimonas sp.]|nr:hypothetical protein [Intestinimonas sp.]
MPQAGFIPAEEVKNGAPCRRSRLGRNITVTSEDGLTEFTFTLTLA